MWFSWLCLGKSLIESKTRKTNHPTLPGPLTLPVTLLTIVAIPVPLLASHLRHPHPMAMAAGASAQVSIGEVRQKCAWGRGEHWGKGVRLMAY